MSYPNLFVLGYTALCIGMFLIGFISAFIQI